MTSTFLGARDSKVLEPAVAGLFYPASAEVLSRTLDDLLAEAPKVEVPELRALICPHAGYRFSGPTAACGYRQLEGTDFRTVLVIGPSHYALFKGAALPDVQSLRTPLGEMNVSAELPHLGALPPFVLEPACRLKRPEWWRERPGGPWADTPFTWEHSVEVQLPFLQKMLPKAELIPVLFGELDPREVAEILVRRLDDTTLLVISSDLSHYHTYAEAKRRDASCVKAICDLDIDAMGQEEACGKAPIQALLHVAKLKGWKAKVLDARSSGDMGADKDSVVGYAAIAFCATGKPMVAVSRSQVFSPSERKYLLDLARRALLAAVGCQPPPKPEEGQLPARMRENGACFVTLTRQGELQGCIGHILPMEPLWKSVVDNARAAALKDPRFRPVSSGELDQIEIEISVLTRPEPLSFSSSADLLQKLCPGEDGVILKRGSLQATFLPQVWKQFTSAEEFLRQLSIKAKGNADLWKQTGVEVLIYRVEAFKEG